MGIKGGRIHRETALREIPHKTVIVIREANMEILVEIMRG
jgi:hypothetical protein